MKLLFTVVVLVASVGQVQAGLIVRGTDSLGNQLIYDDDLDITWYDFSNARLEWQDQDDWASNLTVNFGGTSLTEWRLPSTVDGLLVQGFDGTTTAGFNITTSEMGHLFYTELGGRGSFDTSGTFLPNAESGLNNTGVFQNLDDGKIDNLGGYWSSDYSLVPLLSWVFTFNNGTQDAIINVGNVNLGLAVHEGDVASPVPEPSSIALLAIGAIGLIGYRRRKRKMAA